MWNNKQSLRGHRNALVVLTKPTRARWSPSPHLPYRRRAVVESPHYLQSLTLDSASGHRLTSRRHGLRLITARVTSPTSVAAMRSAHDFSSCEEDVQRRSSTRHTAFPAILRSLSSAEITRSCHLTVWFLKLIFVMWDWRSHLKFVLLIIIIIIIFESWKNADLRV